MPWLKTSIDWTAKAMTQTLLWPLTIVTDSVTILEIHIRATPVSIGGPNDWVDEKPPLKLQAAIDARLCGKMRVPGTSVSNIYAGSIFSGSIVINIACWIDQRSTRIHQWSSLVKTHCLVMGMLQTTTDRDARPQARRTEIDWALPMLTLVPRAIGCEGLRHHRGSDVGGF